MLVAVIVISAVITVCGCDYELLSARYFAYYLCVSPGLWEIGLQKGKLRLRGAMLKVTPPGSEQAGCEPSSVCHIPLAPPHATSHRCLGRADLPSLSWPRAHRVDLTPQGPSGCPAPLMDASGGYLLPERLPRPRP